MVCPAGLSGLSCSLAAHELHTKNERILFRKGSDYVRRSYGKCQAWRVDIESDLVIHKSTHMVQGTTFLILLYHLDKW